MPAGLRAAYIAAVQAGAPEIYRVTRSEVGIRAINLAQGFESEFTVDGLHVAPQNGRGAWSSTLSLSGYGCAGELVAPGSAEPEGTGNRVEYRRQDGAGAAMVEWYVNGPLGLEHGFTVSSEPPCLDDETRELVIEMSLGDELSATLSKDGEEVALRDARGAAVLHYTNLFVHDAEGRELPAYLAAAGPTLSIHVDATDAEYPIVVDPLIVMQEAKLLAADGAAGDLFGVSVAVDGDTAVVGAPADDDNGDSSGAAYVFVRSGMTWAQQAKLLPDDGAAFEVFGNSVAVSGDTAVVTAPNKAAYVFVRANGSWTQEAKLVADDLGFQDSFGVSVAVDGDTAVVGSQFDDNENGDDAGAAYVFVRADGSWTQQTKLLAGDAEVGDNFGISVAVAGDTALVGLGAPDNFNVGAAYVFARSGGSWLQQAKLLADDGVFDDLFGGSVAVMEDRAVVGAFFDDNANGTDAGAAYVFVRSGNSWSQQAKLLADDGAAGDRFGSSVAVAGDTIVVGASSDDDNGQSAGAAYAFVWSGEAWSQEAKLLAPDGAAGDRFGCDVAMAGETAVVGTCTSDEGVSAGAAYVFDLKLADLKLEALNPNPGLLEGDQVTIDVERLATGGAPVVGAAADGVTRVLLRATVPSSGEVEFSLVDAEAPEDGSLSHIELGGEPGLDFVTVPVHETSEGFQAFAIYLVPDEFNRGGDDELAERPVHFQARFLPDEGETLEAEKPFRLVRPPVVLIHGLWSNGGTWKFPLASDDRFTITRADYESTSASAFAINRNVLSGYIREALTRQRGQGIAATQVDVAGHSMGGLLSREHVRSETYSSPHNFGEGDIHKLLTLNTPHTGSPLANLLLFLRDDLPEPVSELIRNVFRKVDMPLDQGCPEQGCAEVETAIDDLANGSDAIALIEHTPVPSHALVGTGGVFSTDGVLLFQLLDFLGIDTTDIFADIQHDTVVGRPSQEGGLPESAITVFETPDSIHTKVTTSTDYSIRVVELFNSRAAGPEFAEFPAPSILSQLLEEVLLVAEASASGVVEDGAVITAPDDGTVVFGGDTVPVTVEAQEGFDLQRVLIVSKVGALDMPAGPFTGDFHVPLDFVGDLELIALGADGDGNLTSSQPITLHVLSPAELQSVMVLNGDSILFGIGAERQLYVVGNYSDGVLRDVTDPSTGTVFQSDEPGIASVSSSGLVTAAGEGIATVVALNGPHQDSISVTVLEGDMTPPTVGVTANPSTLWPANLKLKAVTLSVDVVDDEDPQPVCAITSVTADEPAEGDIFITGPFTVNLRAERSDAGDGRVYSIVVVCNDEAGNSAFDVAEVVVPLKKGKKK